MTPEFKPWPKIPRWNKPAYITEKIDGTNACVIVLEDGSVHAQSRRRIITPADDNFGFAAWVQEHADELSPGLGEGYHYGEWYGRGIQRGYGLDHKRFALFNVDRWSKEDSCKPACCDVVPVLWRGPCGHVGIAATLCAEQLGADGSVLVSGFMKPEGLVIYLTASRTTHKVLLEGDDVPKSVAA